MASEFKSKTTATRAEDHNVLRVFNHSIRWGAGGIVYESDRRHATAITPEVRESRNDNIGNSGVAGRNTPSTSTGQTGASRGAGVLK